MEDLMKILLTDPEEMISMVKNFIGKYKPVVYGIAKELLEIYKDYASNIEYPATIAKERKILFDAYVAAGFTEDQALALILNDNIHLMDVMKNTVGKVEMK